MLSFGMALPASLLCCALTIHIKLHISGRFKKLAPFPFFTKFSQNRPNYREQSAFRQNISKFHSLRKTGKRVGRNIPEVLKLTLSSFEVRFPKEIGQLSVTIQDVTHGKFLLWFKISRTLLVSVFLNLIKLSF